MAEHRGHNIANETCVDNASIESSSFPLLVISVDIEADGPAPSVSSLRMLGVCAIDPSQLNADDPLSVPRAIVTQREWCVAPQPGKTANVSTLQWLSEQGGLLTEIEARQQSVDVVMREFIVDWLLPLQRQWRIEWVAKPSWFDRMWIEELFHLYKPDNVPYDALGHRVSCLRTLLQAVSWVKPHIPHEKLHTMFNPFSLPHTHRALDDAIEQGVTFCFVKKFLRHIGRASQSLSSTSSATHASQRDRYNVHEHGATLPCTLNDSERDCSTLGATDIETHYSPMPLPRTAALPWRKNAGRNTTSDRERHQQQGRYSTNASGAETNKVSFKDVQSTLTREDFPALTQTSVPAASSLSQNTWKHGH